MASCAAIWVVLLLVAGTFAVGEALNSKAGDVSRSNFTQVNLQVPQVSCRNSTGLGILCDGDSVDDFRNGSVQMTTESHNSTGHVMFRERIPMLDLVTKRSPSFSSNFTFRMTRRNGSGDGMAFFMVGNASYRGYFGSTFGVYKWNDYNQSIFAIEYDTYFNQDIDPANDNNHVGIDFKDIYSRTTGSAGYVGVNLLGGYAITTWIDYDSVAKSLEVRIANGTAATAIKPTHSLVWTTVDFSQIVDEYMSMGISASSGEAYHELLSMSLQTTLPLMPQVAKHGLGIAGIIGIAVGVAVAVAVLGVALWYFYRSRNGELKFFTGQDPLSADMMDMPTRFSYQQLRRATNEFKESSRLGQGASSSVYRGVIPGTSQEVAVKKVENRSKKGEKQFLVEIKVVSRLRHRNLVKLLGWCSDNGNYLLVYELMPNGSLDKHLHGGDDIFDTETNDIELESSTSGSGHGYALTPSLSPIFSPLPTPSLSPIFSPLPTPVLPWSRRSAIVRGVAAGLAYLHDEYAQRVIHRDIKTSNVMLDEEFNARLGDFGLARFIDHSKNLTNTQLAGTIGYIAPEQILTWTSTDKTDMYAFGILVLEITCAKRPIDSEAPPEAMILVDWVWNLLSEQKLLKAVDPRLGSDFLTDEAANMLLIGLLCCHPDPEKRPTIRQVQQYLGGDVTLPAVPSTKPIFHINATANQQRRQELANTEAIGITVADGYPRGSSSFSTMTSNDSLISSDTMGSLGR